MRLPMERPHHPPSLLLGALACAADLVARRRRSTLPRAGASQIPTIAVHGLALGGACKTPACLWLAERLARLTGGRVAVGTRPRSVVADEIELYRRRLPGVPVFPEKHPLRAIERAAAAGCRAVVLDDPSLTSAAPAHLRLVCLGPDDDWKQPVFPAGPRRPGAVRPDEADHLLLFDRAMPPHGVAGSAGRARVEVAGFLPLEEWSRGVPRAAAAGAPTPAFVLCAVARPERVVRAVEGAGCRVVGTTFRRDHAPLPPALLFRTARLAREAGARWIVVTEKDAARMGASPGPVAGADPAWMVVRVELRVEGGEELLERFLRSAGRPGGP